MAKQTALANLFRRPAEADAWIADRQPKTPTEKPARLVVELRPDLHRRLKGRCGMEGTKIKAVIESLLEQYLTTSTDAQ